MIGIACLVGYVGLLSFLSLNPWLRPSPAPMIGLLKWDLFEHTVAYGGLSIIIAVVLRHFGMGAWAALPGLGISSVVGILLEYGQLYLTSDRSFSVTDIYANIFGALAGVFVYVVGWSKNYTPATRK